jgi:hypothetical protein
MRRRELAPRNEPPRGCGLVGHGIHTSAKFAT